MIFEKLVKDVTASGGVITVEFASGETSTFNVFSEKIYSKDILGKSTVSYNDEEPTAYGQYSVGSDGSVKFKDTSKVISIKDKVVSGGLSIPDYDSEKVYKLNEVFNYNNIPVYSLVDNKEIVVSHSDSIGDSTPVHVSMYVDNVYTDGNKLSLESGSYTQIAKYNDDDGSIIMSIENSDSVGQKQHIIGDIFFSVLDGTLKHGDDEIFTNVRSYTKYRNMLFILVDDTVYCYRIGKYDRYIWRDKIGMLDGVDTEVSVSYGSRAISIFIKDESRALIKRFGVEKSIYLPSTVTSFSLLRNKNKALYSSDGDIFVVDPFMSEVAAVDNDYFYGNFSCPTTIQLSYTFDESPSVVIENYGSTYKDLNGNNVKSIAVIGDTVFGETGDVIQRIETTSGSIASVSNTITGTSQSIQGGINGIFSVGESLYIISDGYVKKINTSTLEIDTTIDISSNISGKPFRVGTGPMGISILTDNGTVGIYSNIYSTPDKTATISAYSSSSYIAPVSQNGVWVSDSSGSDNNAYNVLFDTGLIDGQIRLKAFETISMTQIGSSMYALESGSSSTSLKKYNSHVIVDMI